MSVHPFPARRILRQAPSPATDRVETLLIVGLLFTTAIQIGLCAWAWAWAWLA